MTTHRGGTHAAPGRPNGGGFRAEDDPVLTAIRELTAARDLLNERIRPDRLRPRMHLPPALPLADLAQAAGLSISGVRVAYDHTHIHAAQQLAHPAPRVEAVDR